MKFFKTVLFALAILSFSSASQAAVYQVDADHTTVSFKIRHLFSKVQGNFKKYEGTLEYEPGKPETWNASGTIDVNSIDTNVPERDKHLKSADFFDVEKFPTISFKTTKVVESSETNAKLEGLLTMHGVEKPVLLDVDILGVGKDPWGNVRASFTVKTQISRKDFGIVWNEKLESGGVLLGEEIDIILEVEGIQKKA